MKRLLQALLILAVIVVAAYYLFVDGLIRSAIESEGSRALKAKLDVAGADFRLFPTRLSLQGVQATDPDDPLRNAAQAETVVIDLAFNELFSRRIIADQVHIHDLRFDQPRSAGGAIAGLTPPAAQTPSDESGAAPQDAQLAEARRRVQGELQRIRQDLTTLRGEWQERLRSVPDEAKINDYRARAQQLRGAGGANRLAEAEQLRREVQADLQNIRRLQEQFQRDSQRAQQEFAEAQSLPERELGRAGAGVNGAGVGNAGAALLGARLKPIADRLVALAARAAGAPAQDTQWPMLARMVMLDGRVDLGASPLRFEGVINNVTQQPVFWDVATDFDLKGAADQPGRLSATGTLDLRRLPGISAHVSLEQFPVQKLVLSARRELAITVDQAVAAIHGNLALTGNQIDLKADTRFDQAALTVIAADSPAAQAAASVLRGVSALDFTLQVSGAVQNPSVSLRSDLDQQIAAAIGQQAAAFAGPLRAQLQQELAPDLAAIDQLRADINGLQQSVAARQQALNALVNLRGF